MTKKLLIIIPLALILAAALIAFLPHRVPEGFYSAKNENRAVFAFGMEAVSFNISSDGSGFVSLESSSGSVDVVSFKSHSVSSDRITFSGLSASSGRDPGESLSFVFTKEKETLVISSCHYERIRSWE